MASRAGWRHSKEGRNLRRWAKALYPKGSLGYVMLKRVARQEGRCWVELARDTMEQVEACRPSATPPS